MDKFFKIDEDVCMKAGEDALYVEKDGFIHKYVPEDFKSEEDYGRAIDRYLLLNDCCEVVRCKNCKFAAHEISLNTDSCGKWCNYFDRVVSFMGYCAWGESE